jgi:hypothetical protein
MIPLDKSIYNTHSVFIFWAVVYVHMLVTLEPWEYVNACNVGIARFAANWDKTDAPHYKKELMEDDRTAQVASAICELAVAKAANRYWSGHVWHKSEHNRYRDVPDVGSNIEVRRVRTGETAAVRLHQLGKGLVLFVAQPKPPEFREVEVWGWLDYDEAWSLAEPAHYAPDTTRLLHRSHLKPLREV